MFTMYQADCLWRENNCRYPHAVLVTDAETLAKAVSRDCVCVKYKDNYRKNENFEESDCLPLDFDNKHSDDPNEWVRPENLRDSFPGVAIGIHYSRNHMKTKEGKGPRPRFHAFIWIRRVTDPEAYKAKKQMLAAMFPYVDPNALDAARFLFGTEDPEVEFYPGMLTLDDFFEEEDFDSAIPEGARNSTMFTFAMKVLKRYGDTKEARQKFLQKAEQCSPPLEEQELRTIWKSGKRYYAKIAAEPGYVKPEEYNGTLPPNWEEPIPLGDHAVEAFPIDALPSPVANYVKAVAENTQTPIDMAAAASLSILATCLQGKFRIQGKPGWLEPLNIYVLSIAAPSERKSAVLSALLAPVNKYEAEYNRRNAAAVEASKAQKRVLERRLKAVEDKVSKGNADSSELMRIAEEITSFQELIPLRLYVDDVTTEKLVSVIAENNGRSAIISSEAGIFDTLAGIYSKNVNIDVMLKAYSGDVIRVDRIGRESESIMSPALTILLMAQPSIISAVLSNQTFRGRGLTARFLYCMPESKVGRRNYRSAAVPDRIATEYADCIYNLLREDYPAEPETITLSPEADMLLAAFADDLEPRLQTEFAEIADWAGKIVGNTLRVSGLLCRASIYRSNEFLEKSERLVVDAQTMSDAIRIGKYFINHAMAAFDVLPGDSMVQQARKVLEVIRGNRLTEVTRRVIMRKCRQFKKAADIQPVLEFLADYGYLAEKTVYCQRHQGQNIPVYVTNPKIFE